ELCQRLQQGVGADAVIAGEDFAYGPLGVGGVGFLDDLDELAVVVADDAAVAVGIVENGGSHGGGGLFLAMGIKERSQDFAADQGPVPGENDDIAAVLADVILA